MAQTTGKESLDAVPVAPAGTEIPAPEVKVDAKPSFTGPRLSYGLNAGTSISNMGSASFLEPTARYHITNRFRGFASFSYMAVLPQQYMATSAEGGTEMRRTGVQSNYIVSVGGDYLVSDRLMLSGRVWKNMAPPGAGQYSISNHHLGFLNPGRHGADFRATYKITNNLSVSGAVRTTSEGSPHLSPFGSNIGNSPFGW